MRATTALRWVGAHWFLPALFAATGVYGANVTIVSGYPAADLASSSFALYLAGPLSAAHVATRFRGFPRFLAPLRSPRSGLLVTAQSWWAVLLGAPVVVCSGVVTAARTLPDDRFAWALLLIDFLTVSACVLLGLAFAWALPIVVAVPAATLVPLLWFAYGAGSGSALLHNLNSIFAACCASSTRPASAAVTGSLALTTTICGGLCLLLVPREWARVSRLVLVPAVVGILGAAFGMGTGVATASPAPLTVQAVQPRTTTLRCEVHSRLPVCLWPESRGRADDLVSIVGRLNTRLARWRLAPVTGITQGDRDQRFLSVQAGDQLSDGDLRYSLAAAYVDRAAGCIGAFGRARDERVAVVSLGAGLTVTDLRRRFDPTTVTAAQARLAGEHASPGAMRTWFLGGLAHVGCGPER